MVKDYRRERSFTVPIGCDSAVGNGLAPFRFDVENYRQRKHFCTVPIGCVPEGVKPLPYVGWLVVLRIEQAPSVRVLVILRMIVVGNGLVPFRLDVIPP